MQRPEGTCVPGLKYAGRRGRGRRGWQLECSGLELVNHEKGGADTGRLVQLLSVQQQGIRGMGEGQRSRSWSWP